MEVTKSNFKTILPEIEKSIKNCTFLSIDCELTGLYAATSTTNSYDTPKQYYEKLRESCKDFLIIQFGLSIFRWDDNELKFKQQTYNFYIFRSPINKNISDQRFLCQTTSIEFLITNEFDFNKLFKNGITYLNIDEEEKYLERLEENYNKYINDTSNKTNNQNSSEKNHLIIPEDNKPYIDNATKLYDNFLETDDQDELELPKCNSFVRRLMYQMTNEKYLQKIILQTKILDNKDRILFAKKFKSHEDEERIFKENYENQLNNLNDFLGFSKIIRLISESDKLVVGHNLSLDLLHTVDKFVTPLPENYEEFKECLHSCLSKVLDTKYMSTSEPFNDLISSSVLKDLLTTVQQEPFKLPPVEIEDDCQGYSINDNKQHEAGYDAYITGLSFISMWNYLNENNNSFNNFNQLKPYINKIYLMALQDSQYFHLGGEDLKPSRDHVFYLTFPKEWKLNNLIQLFSPFGQVHVAWINETSAYVGLQNRNQSTFVLNTLTKNETCKIITFNKRQLQLSGNKNSLTASPSTTIVGSKRKQSENSSNKINNNNKKMKTHQQLKQGSFSNRFAPLMGEDDDESQSKSDNKKSPTDDKKSKTTKKTFTEPNSWE